MLDNYSFVSAEAMVLFHNNRDVMESVFVLMFGAEGRKVLESTCTGKAFINQLATLIYELKYVYTCF